MAEALSLFQQAHTLAPDDPNATYCVGRGLYRSGQYTAAEPLLEASMTEPGLTPFRRFRAAMLLAQDELQLQHPERARSLLNELASKEPAAAPPLLNLFHARRLFLLSQLSPSKVDIAEALEVLACVRRLGVGRRAAISPRQRSIDSRCRTVKVSVHAIGSGDSSRKSQSESGRIVEIAVGARA